jgi:hypothetical protein
MRSLQFQGGDLQGRATHYPTIIGAHAGVTAIRNSWDEIELWPVARKMVTQMENQSPHIGIEHLVEWEQMRFERLTDIALPELSANWQVMPRKNEITSTFAWVHHKGFRLHPTQSGSVTASRALSTLRGQGAKGSQGCHRKS